MINFYFEILNKPGSVAGPQFLYENLKLFSLNDDNLLLHTKPTNKKNTVNIFEFIFKIFEFFKSSCFCSLLIF